MKGDAVSASVSVAPTSAVKNQLPPITFPAEYDPPMSYVTPIWANNLPPCRSAAGAAAYASASGAARTNNQLEGIDSLLRRQNRF